MRPPAFWDIDAPRSSSRLTRALLSPLGRLYALVTARRIATTIPAPAPIPVICIGNLTVGGTGKTPVTLAFLKLAKDLGFTPAALTRGWGGREKKPTQVDPGVHSAKQVGDEPMLLAQSAPTFIDPNRVEGAHMAAAKGADLIIMDDGHQNPKLEKTLSLIVVDALTGWGSGYIIPAGPLREPVASGLARANGVIVMCPSAGFEPDYHQLGLTELEIPVLKAWLEPSTPPPTGPVIAFAGIGRPDKFYDSLTRAGAQIADTASFPDHHPFTPDELNTLADLATAHKASLITTQKDWVRLPSRYRSAITAWPVNARFEQVERVRDLILTLKDSHKPS